MSTLGGTGSSICGQIPEIDVLTVSQSWALIEQAMRSTVFDKKVCFHASKLKNAGQNLSSCDFLCSAFNLFQEENVTFSSPLPVDSIGKKFQNLIFRQIVFFFAAFIKHDFAVVQDDHAIAVFQSVF